MLAHVHIGAPCQYLSCDPGLHKRSGQENWRYGTTYNLPRRRLTQSGRMTCYPHFVQANASDAEILEVEGIPLWNERHDDDDSYPDAPEEECQERLTLQTTKLSA